MASLSDWRRAGANVIRHIADARPTPVRATDATTSGTAERDRPRGRQARLVNSTTGAGSGLDKDLSVEIIARRLERSEAERLEQMSWAASRMVRAKVDDMFVRGREFTGDDGAADQMEEAEDKLGVMTALPDAMIAGRIFGTALMIVCTTDGNFDAPLEPDDINEGDIANLLVVDRWACAVENWVTDPRVPGYGRPYQYRVSLRTIGSPNPTATGYEAPAGSLPVGPVNGMIGLPTTSGNIVVNRDRVFRFDGIKSPLTEGWLYGPWQREWGISVLTRAIDEVLRDIAINAGVGHLVQEASVWVQKLQGFKDALMGKPDRNDPTADEIAAEVNLLRSIYRTTFIDAEDEATRVSVPFSGLAPIMDKMAQRLAAIEGIPITRFLGTSATGLNATGEGDARDWRITVNALQNRLLTPVLKRLDKMVARNAGLAEPPEYQWKPLGDLTPMEEAELDYKRTETATLALQAAGIDENEYRDRLEQMEWWGELGKFDPPEPEFDMGQLMGAPPNGNGSMPPDMRELPPGGNKPPQPAER